MISKPIAVVLFSGLMVPVALFAACNGSTVADTGSTTAGSGGTTATSTSAGTGGTSTTTSSTATTTTTGTGGSAADAGNPGTITCGTATCNSTSVAGQITLEPCCPTDANTCGFNLAPVASFLPVPAGCMELMRPGTVDTSCPTLSVSAIGQTVPLPGCCAANGICGAITDFSAYDSALNFGCADTTGFPDAGPPQSCGASSDGGTEDGGTDGGGTDDGGTDGGVDGG
jgi:hypothetical protein